MCPNRMEGTEDKWQKTSQVHLWNINNLHKHEKAESLIIIRTTRNIHNRKYSQHANSKVKRKNQHWENLSCSWWDCIFKTTALFLLWSFHIESQFLDINICILQLSWEIINRISLVLYKKVATDILLTITHFTTKCEEISMFGILHIILGSSEKKSST